jgi:peptidyl-prolyl cis-trans isomerase C
VFNARPFIRIAVLAGLGLAAARAPAQTADLPAAGSPPGLPPPGAEAFASLQALEAALDRSGSTVIAEVGPHAVTWADIADVIRAMPAIAGGVPFPVLYQRAATQQLEQAALVLRAETAGLDKDPVVRRRVRNAADQALATEVIRRSLAPNLTDQALHATYDALVANKPAPEEVNIRLIMVNSQAEATALIGQLRGGANFADLATKYSRDGTAANGGELGYGRQDVMSPEIGAVAFALAPGQMTDYPVRSGNAWFIIRVEARRQPPAPTFESARVALEQDIIHAGTPFLMQEALKAAPVKYHGAAGAAGPAPGDAVKE